jgi:uncharacterized protein YggE
MRTWTVPVAIVGGVAVTAASFMAVTRDPGTRPASAQTTSVPATLGKTISVDATGTVRVKPDTATVNLGVQAERPTAQEAMAAASTAAQGVIDALKAAGISEDDITTTDLSLWPRTEDDGKAIMGYTATNSVNARIRAIDKAGATIDAATKAAGDDARVNGISFSVSDPTAVAGEARAQAVARARVQAEELAKAAGVTVGPVEQIATVSYDVPAPMSSVGGAEARDAAVPIQPGTQDVTARVTMVFELVG